MKRKLWQWKIGQGLLTQLAQISWFVHLVWPIYTSNWLCKHYEQPAWAYCSRKIRKCWYVRNKRNHSCNWNSEFTVHRLWDTQFQERILCWIHHTLQTLNELLSHTTENIGSNWIWEHFHRYLYEQQSICGRILQHCGGFSNSRIQRNNSFICLRDQTWSASFYQGKKEIIDIPPLKI